MILKTYTRMLTTDAEKSLDLLRRVYGNEPHFRSSFKDWELIGIGDVLLVAGTDESLVPIRGSFGPIVVTDLEEIERTLKDARVRITQPIDTGPTGRYLYAEHPDGAVVEYCEWRDDLVEKWVRKPQREGKLSSQI